MRNMSRRSLLGLGAGAAAAAGLAGCGSGSAGKAGTAHNTKDKGNQGAGAGPDKSRPVRLIGDGSTADTGPQPHQPAKPVPMQPGETPPQFVIFSWDGAGEVGNGLFPRFLQLAKEHNAGMTFFLSGLYLLPESKKTLYHPEQWRRRLGHRLPQR